MMPKKSIIKAKITENLLLERDPAKIHMRDGTVKLLTDVEQSVISKLQNTINFIPNVYCSESAYEILLEKGIID